MDRLSKIMVARNLCSRRKADDWIEKGWVLANGRRPELGERFPDDVEIEILHRARAEQDEHATVLLHKPVGIVSAQPEKDYQPAIQLLTAENEWKREDEMERRNTFSDSSSAKPEPRSLRNLAVAGRLDIDSSGLLIFTQDGRLAKQILGENSDVEKEYLVRVEGEIDRDGLARIARGLECQDGTRFRPAFAEWLNEDQLRIILREGKKRQIRVMCTEIGLRVTGLKRVRVGKVVLGNLPLGQWRYLLPHEIF